MRVCVCVVYMQGWIKRPSPQEDKLVVITVILGTEREMYEPPRMALMLMLMQSLDASFT